MSLVEVRVRRGGSGAARGEMLLVPVAEGQVSAALRRLERRARGPLARRARAAGFDGKLEETLVHHGETAVALLGLGPAPVGLDAWRRAGARARHEAERERAPRARADLGSAAPDATAAFVEGFQLAGYRFAGYLSDPERRARVQALTLGGDPQELGAPLAAVAAVVEEIFRARDLVNEPASVATPRFLAERVAALARDIRGLEAEAWAPRRIAREGLNGLLAVARGSREEPRFIRLRWQGAGARRRVVLVGKGITFDSGGLSLKPPKSMETMKYDMAGGAAVIGAVAAAARLRLPVDVTGFVPATENLPGGRAQKPGDVIRFLNGKTVEVLNTDAEGRLILADALALASREKPDAVIDVATLTGACRVALGTLFAGVMGNDERLVAQLVEAGRVAGEPCWQLPLVREYREDLKSPIADLKNVGGEAGTITAALFLAEFVDGVPWAHLDIAGPAFTDKDLPHAPRGGTGFGVRLLLRYLSDLG
ncbi:MAG TPA: leucyl aminopeptidase [Candidatus Limnocylindria bacterium]|nr:leucyl aminopeptidase [Candidatus Limnocylindria bacterium]